MFSTTHSSEQHASMVFSVIIRLFDNNVSWDDRTENSTYSFCDENRESGQGKLLVQSIKPMYKKPVNYNHRFVLIYNDRHRWTTLQRCGLDTKLSFTNAFQSYHFDFPNRQKCRHIYTFCEKSDMKHADMPLPGAKEDTNTTKTPSSLPTKIPRT